MNFLTHNLSVRGRAKMDKVAAIAPQVIANHVGII
jgi:hypothetical protein